MSKRFWLRIRHRGFTLVEVIVVLVILAILAAVLIPSLTGWIDKSHRNAALSGCRCTVMAAQTLASEQYAINGALPKEAEIQTLSQAKGKVSALQFGDGALLHLSYTDDDIIVTYCRHPESCDEHEQIYSFSAPPEYESWMPGKTDYEVGDIVTVGLSLYRCKNKPSGTLQDVSPDKSKAKNYWLVIGTSDGSELSYSYTQHYAKGVVVKYSGQYYIRTEDGGGTPGNGVNNWEVLTTP